MTIKFDLTFDNGWYYFENHYLVDILDVVTKKISKNGEMQYFHNPLPFYVHYNKKINTGTHIYIDEIQMLSQISNDIFVYIRLSPVTNILEYHTTDNNIVKFIEMDESFKLKTCEALDLKKIIDDGRINKILYAVNNSKKN